LNSWSKAFSENFLDKSGGWRIEKSEREEEMEERHTEWYARL